jgi:hypothetical protein
LQVQLPGHCFQSSHSIASSFCVQPGDENGSNTVAFMSYTIFKQLFYVLHDLCCMNAQLQGLLLLPAEWLT